MRIAAIGAAALLVSAGAATADLKAKVGAPWNGKKIPAGQQCVLDGGKGMTPPIDVTGIPAGTAMIVVEYNDKSYKPLSRNGGHGILGYPVKGASATLPAVPGLTAKLPGGIRVLAKARGTGNYASAGYLPPCSGGRGNSYEAEVKAVDASGKVLDKTRMKLGRY